MDKRSEYLGRLREDTSSSRGYRLKKMLGTYRETRGQLQKSDRIPTDVGPMDYKMAARNFLTLRDPRNSLTMFDDTKNASLAYTLINSADIDDKILGGQVYEKLGRGRKMVPKLLASLNRTQEKISPEQYKSVVRLIEQNTPEEESGLARKAAVGIALILGGVGLGVSSLNTTGNFISNGNNHGSIFGAILILIGLVGTFFYLKSK